jgi:hypothetical protein
MSHPYFAVTDVKGQYRITQVPPGTYVIKTWHEQFGEASENVTVKAGVAAQTDFSYAPSK